MNKETKLKYIQELLYQAYGWLGFNGSQVRHFIDEAKFKIAKIKGSDSHYIKDIDIFNNGKGKGVIDDWQDQIINVLNKLKFEIETEIEEVVAAQAQTLNLHCNRCNHPTIHNIIFDKSEREVGQEIVGASLIDFWTDKHLQILKCIGCGEYSMKKFDIWCDDAPDFPESNVVILPIRNKSSIRLAESFQNTPSNIKSLYTEITEAYIQEINLLCAGGIRAILEAICIDKNIKGGTTPEGYTKSLKGKIFGLCENGLITNKHSEILLHHQYIGDKALHELEKPSSDELEIAIEIIAHTLSSIYELEFKGQEMKNRKDKRNTQ